MIKKILKKMILMLAIFVLFIEIIFVKSLAADNYTCTLALTPDKQEIQPGESVIFTIRVSDINAGPGIAIYNGVIDVNTDIFDVEVRPDDNNVWGVTLIEDSLTITKSDYEAVNEDQAIGKIILTAKEGADLGKQTITLRSNEFSSGNESFTIGDVTANIEIAEKGGGDNQNNTNTNTGGNSSSSNNTNISGNNISSNSVVPTNPNSQNAGLTLPKTGLVDNFLVIGIIIGVIAGIVTYIKYKRAV